MSHKTRVERHIVVDLIAATAAGSLVAAITLKSWVAVLLCLASAVALILLERNNIQEEDQLDIPPEVFEEFTSAAPLPQLTEGDIKILRRTASHPPSDIPQEGLAYYIVGLKDGAAENAKWVLEQMDSE